MEHWTLETFDAYATNGVQTTLAPRATAPATLDKWLADGRVAAIRAAACGVSSNRVDPTGIGGAVGWILDPDGRLFA